MGSPFYWGLEGSLFSRGKGQGFPFLLGWVIGLFDNLLYRIAGIRQSYYSSFAFAQLSEVQGTCILLTAILGLVVPFYMALVQLY